MIFPPHFACTTIARTFLMRIGLARHFPVEEPWPRGWRTAAELQEFRQRYDCAAVNPIPVPDETENWARCYSSDLPRAETTARAMFRGEIASLAALREAEFATFATGRLRLPVWAWRSIIRFAWLTGYASQKTPRDTFLARVRAVADLIESQRDDVLLVSHAGTMFYMRRELLRRGFRGPRFRIAEHARVYVMQSCGCAEDR